MSAIMTRRKRFQIISLNWSVMRQTLGFRNWKIGIDFFEIGLRDYGELRPKSFIFRDFSKFTQEFQANLSPIFQALIFVLT
jgi:hypothetical protein